MSGKIKKVNGTGSRNLKSPGKGNKAPSIFDKPVFSLQNISNNNDYSFKHCSKDEKLALMERLVFLSDYRWSQIHSADRHGYGSEKVTIPRGHLAPGVPKDVIYYALRFATGNKPFVGYKCSNGVFHILWIDRKYKLYSHG